ncbi:MAG: hypothetical protein JST01_24260 [Cyanobacteria bacterium SZAS TMP-1]|nr:hypothetical protein [Cyanobacteria bacterium SZAS TMP-1]
MLQELNDWPRAYFERADGNPMLFYVVFGEFANLPEVSSSRYRTDGVFPGLKLTHCSQADQPDVLDDFRTGYVWQEFCRENPELAKAVADARECLILSGTLDDQVNLNYLRDSIGLLTFLMDHGGIAISDPQMLRWSK